MDTFISHSSHCQIHNPRNKCVNFKTGLDDMRRNSAQGNDIPKRQSQQDSSKGEGRIDVSCRA